MLRIDRLLVKRFVVPIIGLWERGVFVHPTAVVENLGDLGDGVTVWHFCHVSGGSRRHRFVIVSSDENRRPSHSVFPG